MATRKQRTTRRSAAAKTPTFGVDPNASLSTSIGSSGLQQSGGFVTEEFLPELSGQRGMRMYREMSANSPVIGGFMFAIEMLMRQATWTVQPADDTEPAQKEADFLDEVLFRDMNRPWGATITEICSMCTYGFAPLEIMWKRRAGEQPERTKANPDAPASSLFDDNRIGVEKIALRAQPTIFRWDIATNDEIVGFWQQPYDKPQAYVPMEKVLLFRTNEAKENPEGVSLLRTAYRPYYFAKKIEEIEAIGVERDLAGLPVVRLPMAMMASNASAEEKAAYRGWQRMLRNIRRDKQEGIILPSDRDQNGNYIFDLLLMSAGSGSRSSIDTNKIIERYNRLMAMSVLADFLFLGQQAVGSFALSSDKTAMFATALGALLDAIEGVFNGSFVPRLWRYNGLPTELMPKLKRGDVETPNLAELAGYISSLAGAGMPLFPDRDLENKLRQFGSLPQAPEDGETMPVPILPGLDQAEVLGE